MDLIKNLRWKEGRLRHLPRRLVLECLINRFRGIKLPAKDIIDEILDDFGFDSLKQWCDWKDSFDRLVFEKWVEKQSGRLFCTGCGERCTTFTSKKGDEYEKCASGRCEFFHKIGSPFATIERK